MAYQVYLIWVLPVCQLQNNVVQLWREHFIVEENMLQIDRSMLTFYDVLNASGHVDKFTDWMCRNPKTEEYYRVDHLIEQTLKKRILNRDADHWTVKVWRVY